MTALDLTILLLCAVGELTALLLVVRKLTR